MGKSSKETDTNPMIKVCPECNEPYKTHYFRCSSCGCELLEKCPSCDEPFDGYKLGKKVKYCMNCPSPILPEEPFELVIKTVGSDDREEVQRFPIDKELGVKDMRNLLLGKAKADRQKKERIEAERKEYEKLKDKGKILE